MIKKSALIGVALLWIISAAAMAQGALFDLDYGEELAMLGADLLPEIDYRQVYTSYVADGIASPPGIHLELPATDITASSGDLVFERGVGGLDEPVLMWTQDGSWIEWTVDVPADGLYHFALEYYPLPGRRSSIRRAVMIDGDYPFADARHVLFPRTWQDQAPPQFDNRGNHLRPRQVEAPIWRVQPFEQEFGLFEEPLLFHLTEGQHTIRIMAIREPMAVRALHVYSRQQLPTYAEFLAALRAEGWVEATSTIKIQAEDATYKTDPTVRREFSSDPLSEPYERGKRLLGEFGGWRWRHAGQEVTWTFTVPETALYQISLKSLQDVNRLPVTRSVQIDGKFLFEEMRGMQFPHGQRWRFDTLGHDEEVWLIPLTAGEHTLTLSPKAHPVADLMWLFEDVMKAMSVISRQIVMLTGSNPDPNREYDLARQIPDLLPRLETIASALEERAAWITQWVDARPPIVNNLEYMVRQIRQMAADHRTMHTRLNTLGSFQQQLGEWVLSLRDQPLLLDYMLIGPPGMSLPRARSTALERASLSLYHFLRSFSEVYEGVGSVYEDTGEGPVLNVWVARGREWVEIMKEMVEEDFTPATGIRVNMRTLPPGGEQSLILSAVAGEAPDVVLGVAAGMPVEFAFRNATLDLTQFPDFEEVAARFRPGALTKLTYNGGVYGLPETQNFSMLFYRKDILAELELEPPDTWDDVYAMIPILKEAGMEFYYGVGDDPTLSGLGFDPFLYQHGGEYYTEDGLDSALDTPEALAAFREWTNLYTNYRIPAVADFYNRMRTGEMPIGVAKYDEYVRLSTAAPELTGWWEMRPMPGRRQPDGTIDRSIGGSGEVAMILRQSNQPEAAWEFLRWWTSADSQIRFGIELEALLGVEARWNSANVEALSQLPWPAEDIAAILEQWEWFKEQPVVLGGYFTYRHIANAWNRRVLQGMPAKEALDIAVKDITREMRKKQEEFGIAPPR